MARQAAIIPSARLRSNRGLERAPSQANADAVFANNRRRCRLLVLMGAMSGLPDD
jgi:hypothetical protein